MLGKPKVVGFMYPTSIYEILEYEQPLVHYELDTPGCLDLHWIILVLLRLVSSANTSNIRLIKNFAEEHPLR